MGRSLTSKGAQTRDSIVRAAVELINLQGFDNVTTAQICDAAGVSNGSFFHYFKSKEDVLSAFVESESRELEGLRGDLLEMDPVDALTEMVAWQADYYQRKGSDFLKHYHSHFVLSDRPESFSYAFVPLASECLMRGQDQGVVRDDVDARVMAELLFSRMIVLVTHEDWPGDDDCEENRRSMRELVLDTYGKLLPLFLKADSLKRE